MEIGIVHLHNLLRWGVLLLGLYAITKSVLGIIHKREFTSKDNLSHILFVVVCHTQLLLGLVLYFIGPTMAGIRTSGVNMMKDAGARFWAVEHLVAMVIGILLVQIGRSLSKKETDPMKKHRKAVIFFGLGLLIILSRIPWDRALFSGM